MEREHLTIVWLHAGGCDGCTMSALGATAPRLEELLAGAPNGSRLQLIHPYLVLDDGDAYMRHLERARQGELGPFVLVVEGVVFDESLAGTGSFSWLGERDGAPVTVDRWVRDLAAAAEAVVAIGSCATWGGVPAAAGNPTGATGINALLGEGAHGLAGLPLVNVPGCAPSGDGFVETLQYLLLHFEGVVPLDLDDLGRPRWLYAEDTPLHGIDAAGGSPAPADGPTAACPVPRRGWINRLGGCVAVGGDCNGCTRTDFPDGTLPLVVR